jgi:hypothetical protein
LADRIAKEAALSKEVQKEDATPAKVCFGPPSSRTDQCTAHKRENRPMKQGLKRSQNAGS